MSLGCLWAASGLPKFCLSMDCPLHAWLACKYIVQCNILSGGAAFKVDDNMINITEGATII